MFRRIKRWFRWQVKFQNDKKTADAVLTRVRSDRQEKSANDPQAAARNRSGQAGHQPGKEQTPDIASTASGSAPSTQ
ncbi:MAG: hypothetical protein AB8B93_18935 [Pseudomonadales bacterium]